MFYLPALNRRYGGILVQQSCRCGTSRGSLCSIDDSRKKTWGDAGSGRRRSRRPIRRARYTAAADKLAVYAYSDNYLIDLRHAVIMDVEAAMAIRKMA
jgi:hypothetical protein